MPALKLLRMLAMALALAVVIAQVALLVRAPPVIETGTAAVGAPFTLTDQNGRRVSDVDLRGRPVVLMFGWARDPDVTPALLQLMDAALGRLGPKYDTLVPVFVTVDPDRDDFQELSRFSKSYSARLVALTGAADDIRRLTAAYRLPVTRIEDTMLPGGYSLDLPGVYYVLGEDGRFRGVVSYSTDSALLASEIATLVKRP